jgi:hypothetical protein
MESKSSIIQGLPFITIILALLLVIVVRVVSRFKKRAFGDHSDKGFSNLKFDVKKETVPKERIKLKCPALIEKTHGVMKVGIKELTLNGAFVTCPNPLPVGETFPIKILIIDLDPQTFNAEVIWNNKNVADEEIVSRGMKVRFLQLSDIERKVINHIVSGMPIR